MIARAAFAAMLVIGGAAGAQTTSIRVDNTGSGPGPDLLARELAGPHDVVGPGAPRFVLRRDSAFSRTVIVLGRDVVIEGRARGDVVVIGGDLYMHPGGQILGRAISFGGAVMVSSPATIDGGATMFRDFTYEIAPMGGGAYALRYRPSVLAKAPRFGFPGLFGVSVPAYDRTDGLSLGFAPVVSPGGGVTATPSLTYRSQLGRVDPFLAVGLQLDRLTSITLDGGRTTASNDRWIRGDLVNSAMFFLDGNDTRNYYRATGATARIARTWEWASSSLVPYAGVRYERASSVRPGLSADGGPWTLLGREDDDRDDRLRPNPSIDDGALTSALFGVSWSWAGYSSTARVTTDAEFAQFAQFTLDGRFEFPTFGTQRLLTEGHFVLSGGDTPRQRYAYIGGPGTLPPLPLLVEGGDELTFLEARYLIPIERVQLPVVGSPLISLREIVGGAKVGGFPRLHQASGIRAAVGVIYAELFVDPDTRRTHAGFGLSTGR